MIRPNPSALIFLLAVLLHGGLTQAQQTKSSEDKTVDAAVRTKAVDLLESLASQIGTLQSAENRARLGSNLAASLWKHNENRARSLLLGVEADIRAGLEQGDLNDHTDAQTRMVFLKLRMDTVERMVGLDPDLALAFLKATKVESDTARPYHVAEWERDLELRLAKEIAAQRPEVAVKLARQSLARGFSDDLRLLLRKLYKKDREQALLLYKEIVSKLRDTGLVQHSPGSNLAISLVHTFKPPLADESTFRELVGLLIDTALQNGCDKRIEGDGARSYFCVEIGSTFAEMQKVDPLRSAKLKHFESSREFHQSEGDYELSEVYQSGTVDEIIALAEKYPDIKRQAYWHAIEKAQTSGDIERARKLVNDYIDDPEERSEALKRLDRAKAWATLNSERLAEVQSILARMPRVQERFWYLLSVAYRFAPSDQKTALKLVGQASEMIGTMKPGRDQTEAQVAVAMIYCLEKSDRGLEIIESMMPKLNELVGAAAKLDGYDSHNLRDGEWNMSSQGSVGALLTRMSQNAAAFAWCDFDRAVSLTAQFERPEIRMMAQLKLAQAVLAGPPKRATVLRFGDWSY